MYKLFTVHVIIGFFSVQNRCILQFIHGSETDETPCGLYKVVLTYKTLDETLVCDPSLQRKLSSTLSSTCTSMWYRVFNFVFQQFPKCKILTLLFIHYACQNFSVRLQRVNYHSHNSYMYSSGYPSEFPLVLTLERNCLKEFLKLIIDNLLAFFVSLQFLFLFLLGWFNEATLEGRHKSWVPFILCFTLQPFQIFSLHLPLIRLHRFSPN